MECPKDFLTLSLSVPNPNIDVSDTQVNTPVPILTPRRRACQIQEKSETIAPPFPWATNRRATVQSYRYLLQNSIITITGSVQCKRCNEKFTMKLDLEKKLDELLKFIEKNKDNMYDRAPKVWTEPVLPTCERCGRENSVAPVLSRTNEKSISPSNWCQRSPCLFYLHDRLQSASS
ncbi:hypothetical protein CR513_37935, partial [Mucuna pruriens]